MITSTKDDYRDKVHRKRKNTTTCMYINDHFSYLWDITISQKWVISEFGGIVGELSAELQKRPLLRFFFFCDARLETPIECGSGPKPSPAAAFFFILCDAILKFFAHLQKFGPHVFPGHSAATTLCLHFRIHTHHSFPATREKHTPPPRHPSSWSVARPRGH